MMKIKKAITGTIVSMALVMCMSLSVFAATTATASFSVELPKKQGDAEVSKVRKATETVYFTVTINSIGTGTDKVCVWTEGDSTGYNFSDPSKQVGLGPNAIFYTHVPDVGENVVLNMDNPVYLDYTVAVTGSWDPH